jgi:hypothetical protein
MWISLLGLLACDGGSPTDCDPAASNCADSGPSGGDTASLDTGGGPAVLTVCGTGADYADIQSAIDAAPKDAIIEVCAGTFAPFAIDAKPVSVIGAGADATRIVATGAPAIVVRNSTVSLAGIGTQGGAGSAIQFENSTVVATDLAVTGVSAAASTDAISVAEGDVSIDGLAFSGNPLASGSAGVRFRSGGPHLLQHATFTGNSASDNPAGLIVVDAGASVTVQNTATWGNALGGYTAASFSGAAAEVMNNSWVGDGANQSYLVVSTDAFFQGNWAIECSQCLSLAGAGAAFNMAYGGTLPDVQVLKLEAGAITENVIADPEPVDAANGDLHLSEASPARDAGNPDARYNDADGSRNDLGAYGGPGGAAW